MAEIHHLGILSQEKHLKVMHNQINLYLFKFLLIILLGLFCSCDSVPKYQVSDIQKELEGIKKIQVDGGPLEVSYEGDSARSKIFLNAYLESPNKEDPGIVYSVVDDLLIVNFNPGNNWSGWPNNHKGFISLTGPKNVRLVVNNGSGPIFVKNADLEEIILNLGSGKMELATLFGNKIHLSAGSGQINGENLTGDMEVTVHSGHGKLHNLEGNVKVEASSGYLELSQVVGLVDGKVSSGKMKLKDIRELGSLKASSGSIQVENGGLGSHTFLDCSSGSIRIQTDEDLGLFNFYLKASSGSVQVGDQKDGDKLEISNGASSTINGNVSSGSIRISN